MHSGAQPFLAKHEQSKKGRFQEEGIDSLHSERLPDHAAGSLREARPIGTELEFHRDACYNAHSEVDGEDLYPETRRLIVTLVAGSERRSFENDDQQR